MQDILSIYQTKQTLKMAKRDKVDHYLMMKCSIHQKRLTTINICMINIKHLNIKAKSNRTKSTNSDIKIIGDFSILLSIMDRSSRQRINKETEDWTPLQLTGT